MFRRNRRRSGWSETAIVDEQKTKKVNKLHKFDLHLQKIQGKMSISAIQTAQLTGELWRMQCGKTQVNNCPVSPWQPDQSVPCELTVLRDPKQD